MIIRLPDEPGVYHAISNAVYHSSPALSCTGLHSLAISPFHYWANHLNPDRPPREETKGQRHGTLAHCSILEPNEFDARYMRIPENAPTRPQERWRNAKKPSYDTLAAFEYWDALDAKVKESGKQVITAEEYETAMRQGESVRRTVPEFVELLAAGEAETSLVWRDESTGVLCRIRPDLRVPTMRILVDVKTFNSADPNEFARQVARMDYHMQGAFYSDGDAAVTGEDIRAFLFLAVEDDYPYAASLNLLDERDIDVGRAKARRLTNLYAACRATGEWPAFPGINQVSLPAWARPRD